MPADPAGDVLFIHEGNYYVRKPDGDVVRLYEIDVTATGLLPKDASTREKILAKALDMAVSKTPSEHEMVVNRHQMQNLLERFADLAYGAITVQALVPGFVDFGVEDSRDLGGELGPVGGVWVHDPQAPHPCDYACGAVYIERTKDKIEATLGTATITFTRDADGSDNVGED